MTRTLFRIVVFSGVLVVVGAAPSARAQETPVTTINPTSADELTVELPKNGPPLVEPDQGEPVAVVPDGQEELFAEMLGRGASLPKGCALAKGDIDGPSVKATYQCADAQVVFELVHPSLASRAATTTTQFAIELRSGTPPEGLAAELATRVRAREGAFQWKWLGRSGGRRASYGSVYTLAAGGILLVTAVLFFWAMRGRRSR